MRLPALLTLAAALAGCADRPKSFANPNGVAGGPIRVLVSISTFESFARAVGGERVVVDTLVPTGASPEDFSPSPRDVEKIHNADVLFENGLGLESWLQHSIESAQADHLRVATLTDGLPAKNGNPHLWMDPVLARGYVEKMRDILSAADPSGKAIYEKNAAAYEARLDKLRADIAAEIATVPAQSRSMIVFHNAWQYYDDRFGLKTVGVLELSPGQEPNPQYVAKLVSLAKADHVRAVFAEPEYSPKLVDTLASSAGIATIEDLYDDSFDAQGKISDYDAMLRYDTRTIVTALGGSAK